jgi:D-xylose transport system ATP-binding protein
MEGQKVAETPLVRMQNMHKRFGGVHAVDDVSIDIFPGEVVGLLGHNGAGKTVLTKMLSGADPGDSGDIFINGNRVEITNPRVAHELGIETIYQALALADNLDATANLFLGREIKTSLGTLDDDQMEAETRKVLRRLNPNFTNIKDSMRTMSGGQRQAVAIARAIFFNAKILIMDEPTAALGPQETELVADLIKQLKKEGIGILLVSHDLHDVFDLSDRISVMKNGKTVGTRRTDEVSKDDVLGMIIMGRMPELAEQA